MDYDLRLPWRILDAGLYAVRVEITLKDGTCRILDARDVVCDLAFWSAVTYALNKTVQTKDASPPSPATLSREWDESMDRYYPALRAIDDIAIRSAINELHRTVVIVRCMLEEHENKKKRIFTLYLSGRCEDCALHGSCHTFNSIECPGRGTYRLTRED